MTVDDMARIHHAAFTVDRAWSGAELTNLLSGRGVKAVTSDSGFALIRVATDEVELLTIAVDPAAQGVGEGDRLMMRWMLAAAELGARQAFLEVADDNRRAIALYRAHGFEIAGRRPGYYARAEGPSVDALLMTAALTSSHSGLSTDPT